MSVVIEECLRHAGLQEVQKGMMGQGYLQPSRHISDDMQKTEECGLFFELNQLK